MTKINEDEYNKLIANLDEEIFQMLSEDSSADDSLEFVIAEVNDQYHLASDIELNDGNNLDVTHEFKRVYEAQYEVFRELEVQEFGVLNILVVDSGRNAWNATWSRKFAEEKAFFIDIESAKKYAEDNRKQGTVFTIAPTPCLYFRLDGIYIFLMDIASNKPFSKWKINRKLKSKNLIILEDFYELFRLNSNNWNYPIPDEENFDVSYVISQISLKELEISNLNCYKSQPVGSGYYLKWNEVEPDYDDLIVKNVFEFLKKCLRKRSTRKGTK